MDWLFNFPKVFDFDTTSIDDAVRSFAVSASGVLDAIKGFLNSFVVGLQTGLSHIPWVVLILLVVLLGWKVRGKLRSGALYGILLFLIGAVGLWDLMLMTLSVVLASVIIALIIGMLFGTGNASGVIATVIYAVVPVIRLTSLGIRQVDKEVVEASTAYGATRWQTLRKVQIPQAMPTIMTGVNQTLMMAMAMVVTTSMIGVRGLGMEVLNAVNRIEIGRVSGSLSYAIITVFQFPLASNLRADSASATRLPP